MERTRNDVSIIMFAVEMIIIVCHGDITFCIFTFVIHHRHHHHPLFQCHCLISRLAEFVVNCKLATSDVLKVK